MSVPSRPSGSLSPPAGWHERCASYCRNDKRKDSTITSRTTELGVARHTRSAPARIAVGIYGASGTTGTELVQLVARHPRAHVAFATSVSHAGESLRRVDPAAPDISLRHPDDVAVTSVDFAFVCLPHGSSAEQVEAIAEEGVPVVDLSGDLRLKSASTHERVYGSPRSQALAQRAAYGLVELDRPAIERATVVANPGCYATCAALPLAPLVRAGVLAGTIVIDAKSGVSGAGRRPQPLTHYCAAVDDVRPYALGRAHRHVPEIEQTLATGDPGVPTIVFCPHVVPMERGMLATIVVTAPGMSHADVRGCLADAYAGEPFVEVLPDGDVARVRSVVRTNRAALSVTGVEGTDQLVLTSAIDNLLKGAAGQAVQNMNLMTGIPETTGLDDPLVRASLREQESA